MREGNEKLFTIFDCLIKKPCIGSLLKAEHHNIYLSKVNYLEIIENNNYQEHEKFLFRTNCLETQDEKKFYFKLLEAFIQLSTSVDNNICNCAINFLLKHSNILEKCFTKFSSVSEMRVCAGADLCGNIRKEKFLKKTLVTALGLEYTFNVDVNLLLYRIKYDRQVTMT